MRHVTSFLPDKIHHDCHVPVNVFDAHQRLSPFESFISDDGESPKLSAPIPYHTVCPNDGDGLILNIDIDSPDPLKERHVKYVRLNSIDAPERGSIHFVKTDDLSNVHHVFALSFPVGSVCLWTISSCRVMYKGMTYKVNDENVVHFYFEKPGLPSGIFRQIITKHVNGLLNTKGGVLVFGVVPNTGKIVGCNIISREQEDLYKLELDQEVRTTRPTVSPSLCRFVITRLEDAPLCVMEIKIGAGPIGEMYMNYSEEVYVIRKRKLFGPLIPQEIKDLVIAKYREEVASSASLLSPAVSRTSASEVEDGEIKS